MDCRKGENELIHVNEAVIVEGKYDKIKLSSIIDALIVETNGFQIFKDKEQMALLRRLADTRGLLVLTDSDSAGFLIRHYLAGSISSNKIKHAYIPDILGKEKRKEKPSKEGKLGVEGVSAEVILEALKRAGVVAEQEKAPAGRKITKTDLYLAGISGGPNSAQKRKALLHKLNLPEHLSTNSLPEILSTLLNYDDFKKLTSEL